MRVFPFKALGTGVALLISLMVLLLVGSSLASLDRTSREAGIEIAREAIEKSVMQCYALEGAYPPSINYLRQYYGLAVDEDQYVIVYERVAQNIYPVINVYFPEEGAQ